MSTDPVELPLVFLVGMPRSGTKLLRELLNRHPDISIFPNESHFIPAFAAQADRYGDLRAHDAFARLYDDLQQTTFFRRIGEQGIRIDRDEWFGRLRGGDLRDALVAMFECYRHMTGSRIVGDKTPEYLTQVPLLRKLFPDAKLVHIMRDPRDYVVSMRKAWGKSLPRAAQRWKAWIRKFRTDVAATDAPFVELKYEDLVAEPRLQLERICAFLGVPFHEAMLTLERPPENLGDARGETAIVATNFGKWRTQLREAEVRRVEEIAGKLMAELGYSPAFVAGDGDVSRVELELCRLRDVASLFRFGWREAGIGGALAEMRPKGRAPR